MNFLSITRKGIKLSILTFICLWFVQINVNGQTSIGTIGSTVTQSFDGLINTGSAAWTEGSTLPVWYSYLVSPSDPGNYTANNGTTTNTGRLYSYGTTSASDRALGINPAGSTGDFSYVGWRLVNNTGKTLKELKVDWTAEQWRVTTSGQQMVRLYYKINSFDLSTPGTEVAAVGSPKFGIAAAQLDGNDGANRVSTITTINLGVGLSPGAEITLIWGVARQAGANQQLGIDDVSVKAKAAQDINVIASLPAFTYGASSVDLNSYFSASSGLALTYSSSNTNVATITGGNTLNIVGPGSFTIYANQPGNADYIAAVQNSQSGTVKPQTPVLEPTSSITSTSFNTSWTIDNGLNDASTTYILQYATSPNIQDAVDNGDPNSNDISGITNKNYNATGLTANQLYYYRVFANNSGLYSGFSQSLTVTTGDNYISDTDGDWDLGTNWDINTSPNPYGNSVTINTEITAYNTARDSIVVNKLIITENGKLNNQEIIHVTGDLIIMSDATGKTGQILNSNSLRLGPLSRVIVRKQFGPNSTHGWYFMGFPYNVTEAQSFLGNTNTPATWGNNFTFEPAKNYYVISYDGNQRDVTGLFNGTSGLNWKDVSPKTFVAGVGYSLTVPSATTIDYVIPHAQKGNIFAASGTRNLTQYTTNGSAYHHSWNLVTSPIASAYDLASTPSQAPYYVWNRLTQSYDVKMAAESYKVYPFEAFFLQAQSGSMSFVDGGRAFKVGAVSNAGSFDELKISISNSTLSDLTRIRFEEGASDDYVIGKDAAKFISGNMKMPQIYTQINGNLVAVNTLPANQKEVNLLTRIRDTGNNFTIKLDNKNSLANFASVKLTDSKTSTVTELLMNDYNFTESDTTEVSRFKISVVYNDASAVNTIEDLGLSVDVSSDRAVINGLSATANIQLFDMAGKLIYTANQIRDGYVINLNSKGVFFLNVITESGNARVKLMNK